MSAQLTVQQLKFWDNVQPAVNADLIGRYYFDGVSKVSVYSANATHAQVRRELDGRCWPIPARLMRLLNQSL